MTIPNAPIRLAVIDSDTGFVRVLAKRVEAMSWQFRSLDAPVPPHELVAMRLNALVVDISLLGPRAWEYVEAIGEGIPGLGLIVCTGQSTVAQRVWGYAMAHGDRSVDVFVRKLRQKLEGASPGWRYIHTHFGIGYRFQPESDPAEEAPEPPADAAETSQGDEAEPPPATADGRPPALRAIG